MHYSIKVLPAVDLENDRGRRTWEWRLPDGRQVTVYSRRAGENFGAHFHTGEDSSKNPELLLLISGRLRFKFKLSRFGDWISETLNAADGPVELVLQPHILHQVYAETDVLYIEFRRTYFDPEKPDTYPPEKFT